MNTIKCVLIFVMVFISNFSRAQELMKTEASSKIDFGLEGMLGVSVGKDFYLINVGGPSLLLAINKDWKIGVGALPSIYVSDGKLGTRLGVSPRVDYKNLVIIMPFFHREAVNKWIWSVGLGYKFHKK